MKNLTTDQALKDVRAIVKASGTSFMAGMTVLPLPRREAMYALYAFCRVVDDIADDSPTAKERDEGLQLWRQRIHDLFRKGQASESITTALLLPIERYDLKEKDFMDIIKGMEMDAAKTIVAPSMDELDLYCDLVASAVGRISVRIFGDSSQNAQNVAHHLGRSLQLTNILRDLAEDAARGRLYLPQELLKKHNIETRNPEKLLDHPNLSILCRNLADIAQQHFTHANDEMKKCSRKSMRPARTMRNYYHAILTKLLKENWKNPHKRISLSLCDKVFLALRSMMD